MSEASSVGLLKKSNVCRCQSSVPASEGMYWPNPCRLMYTLVTMIA